MNQHFTTTTTTRTENPVSFSTGAPINYEDLEIIVGAIRLCRWAISLFSFRSLFNPVIFELSSFNKRPCKECALANEQVKGKKNETKKELTTVIKVIAHMPRRKKVGFTL